MYQYRYSFWNEKNFPGFKESLETLYNRSREEYFNSLKLTLGSTNYKEYAKNMAVIDAFLNDMEYHYYSLMKLGLVTNRNFTTVLEEFKKLSLIKILPRNLRRYYALTCQDKVYMNPDLVEFGDLDSSSFQQMIVSHELGHIIHSSWIEEANSFSRELYRNERVQSILKNMGLNSYKYLQYGFDFIDEVTSQDAAERVAYRHMGKSRPTRTYRSDKAIFNHEPYLSNYNLYGEFQEIAVWFARNLRFLNCKVTDSYDEVLKKLVIKSFHKDFIKNIKREIAREPERLDNFIMMLACLGVVKGATYQIMDLNCEENTSNVNGYVEAFYQIAKTNRCDCGEKSHQFTKKG